MSSVFCVRGAPNSTDFDLFITFTTFYMHNNLYNTLKVRKSLLKKNKLQNVPLLSGRTSFSYFDTDITHVFLEQVLLALCEEIIISDVHHKKASINLSSVIVGKKTKHLIPPKPA